MTQEIFYKKVGRRYVPVSTYDDNVMTALPTGFHLIRVDDSWTMYRTQIDPDYATTLAALMDCQEEAYDLLHKMREMKPGPIVGEPSKKDIEMAEYIKTHHPKFAAHWLSSCDLVSGLINFLETKVKNK